uniref:Uncharacterized protein n=1 Tax=Panagrolaimus superbus TaxID=310955 RepID=A0A914YPU4_9BILA
MSAISTAAIVPPSITPTSQQQQFLHGGENGTPQIWPMTTYFEHPTIKNENSFYDHPSSLETAAAQIYSTYTSPAYPSYHHQHHANLIYDGNEHPNGFYDIKPSTTTTTSAVAATEAFMNSEFYYESQQPHGFSYPEYDNQNHFGQHFNTFCQN